MIDPFLLIALLVGVGIAILACPLGCFVVWRRMSYFGATLAHGALLGVALALVLDLAPLVGVLIFGAILAPILIWLQKRHDLSTDTLLGILAHGTLAVGLVAISLIGTRIDIMTFLFGTILAVNMHDLVIVALLIPVVLGTLAYIWRPLLAHTISPEIAAAESQNPTRTELIFTLLIVVVIAVSMKIVGALLILSLLIIPPATARYASTSPERMVILATIIGVISVIIGIISSIALDTPTGPSIVVAAMIFFVIASIPPLITGRHKRLPPPPHAHHDH